MFGSNLAPALGGMGSVVAVGALVERFGRRGTVSNELFQSEIRQNSCKIKNLENFGRKFKKVGKFKFQHFPEYRRNSDKISSKSAQKSPKRIQNDDFLQRFAEKCENV